MRFPIVSNDLSLCVPPLPQRGNRDGFPSLPHHLHGIVSDGGSFGGSGWRSEVDLDVLERLEVRGEVGGERSGSRGSLGEGEDLDGSDVGVLGGRRSLVSLELFEVEVLDEVWRRDGRKGRRRRDWRKVKGRRCEGDGR